MLRVWQLLLLNNGISSTFSLWWPCSSLKSLHDACHTSHTQLHQLPTICLARRNSCGNICDSRGDSPRQWGVDYVVTATETGTGSGTTPCCATTHISRSPRPINRHILLASCIHAWLLLAIKSARQQVAAALWFWCWFLAGIPSPEEDDGWQNHSSCRLCRSPTRGCWKFSFKFCRRSFASFPRGNGNTSKVFPFGGESEVQWSFLYFFFRWHLVAQWHGRGRGHGNRKHGFWSLFVVLWRKIQVALHCQELRKKSEREQKLTAQPGKAAGKSTGSTRALQHGICQGQASHGQGHIHGIHSIVQSSPSSIPYEFPALSRWKTPLAAHFDACNAAMGIASKHWK